MIDSVADVVPLDFSKAFVMRFHNIVIDKLMKYWLDKWALRWIKGGWTARLKGLWSVTRTATDGRSLVVCPRGGQQS